MMARMTSCRRDFLGYFNLFNYSVPVYNFVAWDRFMSPGGKLVLPVGVEGFDVDDPPRIGGVGVQMKKVDEDLTALSDQTT